MLPITRQGLIDRFNNSNLDNNLFLDVIHYLADQADLELESKLREKFNLAERINLICKGNLPAEDQMKMLEVCYRITELKELKTHFKASDPIKLAERDGRGFPIPPPITAIESILNPSTRAKILSASKTILNWIVTAPFAVISNRLGSDLFIFNKSPKEIWQMQNYWVFYKTLIKACRSSGVFFISYFPSNQTAALAFAGTAITYGGLCYLAKYTLKLGDPEPVDTYFPFENLNKRVMEGKIRHGVERIVEKSELAGCWTSFPGQPFRIAFLTGPMGIGKTAFAHSLAWACVYDKNFSYYGKTVLSVNADVLKSFNAAKTLEELFKAIEGREGEFILFFDEAHKAADDMDMGGGYLDTLKTLLPEKNIRCLMATTTDEYEKFIASNKAFADRAKKIELSNFDDNQLENILYETATSHDYNFTLERSAYRAILGTTKIHSEYKDRHEPRRSIDCLKDILGKATEWSPRQLEIKLQKALDLQSKLSQEDRESNLADPHWGTSDQGKLKEAEIDAAEARVNQLKIKIESQTEKLKKIRDLQNQVSKCQKRWEALVNQLRDQSSETSEETQKEYLYTKFILQPHLRASLAKAGKKFEKQFKEKIPLVIDATFVDEVMKEPSQQSMH